MTYLRSQLLTFFTLKQVIGNVTETGIPRLKRWWRFSFKIHIIYHKSYGHYAYVASYLPPIDRTIQCVNIKKYWRSAEYVKWITFQVPIAIWQHCNNYKHADGAFILMQTHNCAAYDHHELTLTILTPWNRRRIIQRTTQLLCSLVLLCGHVGIEVFCVGICYN